MNGKEGMKRFGGGSEGATVPKPNPFRGYSSFHLMERERNPFPNPHLLLFRKISEWCFCNRGRGTWKKKKKKKKRGKG